MARSPDSPESVPPPIITLLTDFGAADVFVGSMKGVILGINPHVQIIDLTHDIPAHNIRAGAYLLHSASRHFPPGTIHVAVVDPGVGSERRPLLVTTRSYHFLAPDNGLLSYILASEPKAEVRELTAKQYFLGTVGSTFHGRDLFAPVAARLAAGATLAQAGTPLDPADLDALELPRAEVGDGTLLAHVLLADGYGNVLLDAERADVDAAGLVRGGAVVVNGVRAAHVTTFADAPAGGLLLYADAYGAPSLAINRGSALEALGLRIDDPVRIERAS